MEPGDRIIDLAGAEGWRDPIVSVALAQALSMFLSTQRWFAGKGGCIERVECDCHDIGFDQAGWLLARIRVWLAGQAEPQDYGLPLALAWDDEGDDQPRPPRSCTLARVRIGARIGLLYDACAREAFSQSILRMMAGNVRIPLGEGWLKFSSTRVFRQWAGEAPGSLSVKCLSLDSSNATLNIGGRMLLKVYRRLRAGINPELEMGRFLSDVAGFGNVAPLAGALEYADGNGTVIALALVQGFIDNQGDAWSYTQDYLRCFLGDCLQQPDALRAADGQVHGRYRRFAATLGRRTGELHRVLALHTGDPAFDPEPITVADLEAWSTRIRNQVAATLDRLKSAQSGLPESMQALAATVLDAREAVLARCVAPALSDPLPMKTRCHGDYHLGQVLLVGDDVIIIDFEGEPLRPLQERRAKHTPLRDVVGLLRSFNYAAHAALRQATTAGMGQWQMLAPHVRVWEEQARSAFLEGYAQAARGCASDPDDPWQVQALLELLTLEKASYELRYELDNRPDWLVIPLGGLCELLSLTMKEVPR